jgi:hypothetical protein
MGAEGVDEGVVAEVTTAASDDHEVARTEFADRSRLRERDANKIAAAHPFGVIRSQ